MGFNFYSITNAIKLMPIRAISLKIPNSEGMNENLNIAQLESESSFNIDQITKNDMTGRVLVITNKITGTFYIPHNLYKNNNLLSQLETYKNAESFTIILGNSSIPPNDFIDVAPIIYNASGELKIKLTHFDYFLSVESVEFRPRIKLSLTAYESNINNLFI
jgi:hypothetical protein